MCVCLGFSECFTFSRLHKQLQWADCLLLGAWWLCPSWALASLSALQEGRKQQLVLVLPIEECIVNCVHVTRTKKSHRVQHPKINHFGRFCFHFSQQPRIWRSLIIFPWLHLCVFGVIEGVKNKSKPASHEQPLSVRHLLACLKG